MHAYYDFSTSVQGVIHFRKSYLGAWLGSGKGVELLRCNGQPRVRGAAGVQLSASTRWQGLDHSLEGGTDSGGQFHHPQGCQPLGIMLYQTIRLLELVQVPNHQGRSTRAAEHQDCCVCTFFLLI